MPAVLGAMQRPAYGWSAKGGVVGNLQRRIVLQDHAHHLRISMPCCPMQRSRPLASIHRPTALEHQPDGVRVVVFRGVRNLTTICFGEYLHELRMILEQGLNGAF